MVVTGLVGATNEWDTSEPTGNHMLMTEQQIQYWTAHGIEFGAHSQTHPDMRNLGEAELVSETAHSRDQLNVITGSRTRSFAFPYGHYDGSALKAVQDNFDLAFTVEEGLNGLGTNLHLLRRTMVLPRDTLFEFGMRLCFGKNPMIGIRRALSRIKRFLLRRE
jgi:peptidoglycan/xylan/chitin deacetylase (PgdA/CDA1 family)